MNNNVNITADVPEIQDKLLDFITQNFFVKRDEIDLEKSLVDAGIIDSIGLVEIITFMEEEYSIVIEEEQMTRDNLGSVVKMVGFIKREIEKSRVVV